jgi:hypothetical protein
VTLAVIADLRRRFGLRDLEPETETTKSEDRVPLIEPAESEGQARHRSERRPER